MSYASNTKDWWPSKEPEVISQVTSQRLKLRTWDKRTCLLRMSQHLCCSLLGSIGKHGLQPQLRRRDEHATARHDNPCQLTQKADPLEPCQGDCQGTLYHFMTCSHPCQIPLKMYCPSCGLNSTGNFTADCAEHAALT